MKKIFLALLLTGQLFAATVMKDNNGGYELNRNGALNRKYSVGTVLARGPFGLKAKYKFADSGGAMGLHSLLDGEGLPVVLPSGAIIRDCLIDTVVHPTSTLSSASLQIQSKLPGDIKADTTIATSNWQAGVMLACLPTGSIGSSIRLASETTLKINIVSEALTAGEINVWVEYVISE